ncbi:hypothetical protein [Ferrimicrobium acidiphilum]|uniref:Uncharacterized protein n=1 Tax=Ferrimicrobium acidiphilum DSM 19497 TaxID=1121877 RepID=A0A0D8FW76_9ACTN|nr:hypothetical protein [Ferrimicrobium acidiphilum]KJE77548.1 hypothetical protein FEAC_06570 [Ferrimicrobium acidiphilum DSM 19497]MCL5053164.1 hypothetical protein [Gammaproteobacteria bacterium]
MNPAPLWAAVILVMTLPETTSSAHIMVADTACACTEVPRRRGTPGTTRSMGWVRLRACTSRLLVNTEDDRVPLADLYRSQQRL